MAEMWIQVENHPWDLCPNNIDRMMGMQLSPSGPPFKPLQGDALILRNYTANWAAPDDHKVNPWDMNEPDPSTTMGTIPGATIECNVGDNVLVHFRNMDMRTDPSTGQLLPATQRAHSLHPHGITFPPQYDGAFPLSPPDTTQAVPAAEAPAWSSVDGSGFKQGDRVPAPIAPGQPGGTFDYHWDTVGWPATAGVWLYHDHSICSSQNVNQGAIGALIIHNPNDPEDVIVGPADLPNGDPNGSPVQRVCIPIPRPVPILPGALTNLVSAGPAVMAAAEGQEAEPERLLKIGDAEFRLDNELSTIIEFCLPPTFINPPANAQYIQLYHQLGNEGMCINGRKFLGNTPTVIGGPNTKMRFGIIGMGSDFHVFHLHGNRWIIPGPDGTDLGTIQNSIQDRAVSQFEDSRTFGPANSFAFTIPQGGGSFFGTSPAGQVGEYHMHCHVLAHMDDGMMGSLLIVNGGELVSLPQGMPCVPPPTTGNNISIIDNQFVPPSITIHVGETVTWTNNGASPHTVTSDPGPSNCNPGNPSTELFNSGVIQPNGGTFTHTFQLAGDNGYHCEVHGCAMAGTVHVTPGAGGIAVPDVVGDLAADAVSTLQAAGLGASVRPINDPACNFIGEVASQSPIAGTVVPRGRIVTIRVGHHVGPCP
jgi:plastocyanin/FtsP/CotA-like multicopper oxidase with cupredoxin domain